MIICMCYGINDSEIKNLIEKGFTKQEIIKKLKLGKNCGICLETFCELFIEAQQIDPD